MSFAVIVPCHHRPSRLPRKLEEEIGGKPVMVRTLERALQSGAKRVAAALSDSSLEPLARAAGAEAILTGAHTSGTSRAAEAIDKLGLETGLTIVVLQADEPFVDPETVRKVAGALGTHPDAVCATAARPITPDEYADPNTVKVVANRRGYAHWFSRSPIPFNRESPGTPPAAARAHLGIYAYVMAFLQKYPGLEASPEEEAERLEQLRVLAHGHRIAVIETADASFGIDTPEDLERARDFAQKAGL